MRLRDVMTRRPLVVSPDASPDAVLRLSATARVHHLPLMDGDRLLGVWCTPDDGPPRLVAVEDVHVAAPDDDAADAVAALLRGSETVVVAENGHPVGMLTRSDVLAIARAALARGVERPPDRPLVVLFVGPAEAGKSTLLEQTIPLLPNCRAGVVRADAEVGTPPVTDRLAGAPAITDARAHWRGGLRDAVDALGDVQVVLVEDRDREPDVRGGPGGDLQVLVLPAGQADRLDAAALREAQAVVLTKLDRADPGVAQRTHDRLRASSPGVMVFGVTADADDPGLRHWAAWLEAQVLPRGHR